MKNELTLHKISEEKLKALRTELAEFKLLELSLGKRTENLVSDVDEHEAKIEELKVILQELVYECDAVVTMSRGGCRFATLEKAREAIQGEK